jgi:hypothetical protein
MPFWESLKAKLERTLLAMRFLHLAIPFIALFALVPAASSAQTGTQPRQTVSQPRTELELGSVTVWLGMAEPDALRQFQAVGYQVSSESTEVSKLVRNGSDVYSVWFKQGKLTFAERDWSTKKGVMAAVLSALASLENQGSKNCTINHQPLRKPNVDTDRVFIECDQRSVELTDGTYDVDGTSYSTTQVMERIGLPE